MPILATLLAHTFFVRDQPLSLSLDLAPLVQAFIPSLPDGHTGGAMRIVAIAAPTALFLFGAFVSLRRSEGAPLFVVSLALLLSVVQLGPHEKATGTALGTFALTAMPLLATINLWIRKGLRPILVLALLLFLTAHGTRTLAWINHSRLHEQERLRMERALAEAKTEIPDLGNDQLLVVGAPPYLFPRPRVNVLDPNHDPEGAHSLGAGNRVVLLQWGAALLTDRGHPERFRFTQAVRISFVPEQELRLESPANRACLPARIPDDEPTFEWSLDPKKSYDPHDFIFVAVGMDRETGRLRLVQQYLVNDVSKEPGEGTRNHYSWRPSIRPSTFHKKEILWEQEELATRGSTLLWAIAKHTDHGAMLEASSFRRISVAP
jgi:hypothetical protein